MKKVGIGDTFNRLTIIGNGKKVPKVKKFICKCICGNIVEVDSGNLRKGNIKSCGCLKKENICNNRIELLGKKFGKLLVIDYYKSINKDVHYKCLCDCGNEPIVNKQKLKNGHTKSCGCYKSEWAIKNKTTHNGKKEHKGEYSSWKSMRSRCADKNNQSYGGKGIRVCDRWDNFENFLYDMGKKPSNKHEIDRIDSDKNYSPDNCRWVTSTINNSNKKKRYLWGIHVNKNNTFRLSLSREYKRRDYTFSNVDTAVIYRDKWAKEYEDNPEHWIIRTLNGFYKEDIEDDYNVS